MSVNTDWDALKIRIEATKDATSRSRVALLATTVAVLSFLIAEFNLYLSFIRQFALDAVLADEHVKTGIEQHRLLEDWVQSTWMTIAPLGIRVHASDATPLGGVALFFLTLWFYYSMRRENRLVGTLLRDTRDAGLDTMNLVYSGVVSYMVFTAIRPGKPAIGNLDDKLRDEPSARSDNSILAQVRNWSRESLLGAKLLFILPPLAILLSVVLDILSVYVMRAPFRIDHEIPGSIEWSLLIYVSVGVVCFVATGYNSIRVIRLDRATGNVLRAYYQQMKARRDLEVSLRIHDQAKPLDVRCDYCSAVARIVRDRNGVRVSVELAPNTPLGTKVENGASSIRERLRDVALDVSTAGQHRLEFSELVEDKAQIESASRAYFRIKRELHRVKNAA